MLKLLSFITALWGENNRRKLNAKTIIIYNPFMGRENRRKPKHTFKESITMATALSAEQLVVIVSPTRAV